MGNLVAVKVWTHHGNEVICEERGHINQFEMASMSAVAGCMPRSIHVEDGILAWEEIERRIQPKVYARSQTGLISLENSHNMAGGTVYPPEVADEICDRAHAADLPVHLDGARIFNASVALGKSVEELTRKFDSVMFCLSKGLGAPVGSMLLGSLEFIEKARVYRKMFGGGMRQAGVLAAAGLVALEKSPARLHEDHANAPFSCRESGAIARHQDRPAQGADQHHHLRCRGHESHRRRHLPRPGATPSPGPSPRPLRPAHGDPLRC